MSALQSCMGGWCTKRQHCANYHAASEARLPEERLCEPGRDGSGIEPRVVLQREAGSWERPGLMASAGWMEMLA